MRETGLFNMTNDPYHIQLMFDTAVTSSTPGVLLQQSTAPMIGLGVVVSSSYVSLGSPHSVMLSGLADATGSLPIVSWSVSGSNQLVESSRQVTQWVGLTAGTSISATNPTAVVTPASLLMKFYQVRAQSFQAGSSGSIALYAKWPRSLR